MEKDSKSALTVAPPSGPNSVLSLADRIKAKTKTDAELIQKKAEDEQQQLGLALTNLSQNALSTTKDVINGQLSALTEGVESTATTIKTALTDQGEAIATSISSIKDQAEKMTDSLTGPDKSIQSLLKEANQTLATAKAEAEETISQAKQWFWMLIGAGLILSLMLFGMTWLLTSGPLYDAKTEDRDWGNGKTYTLILSPGWTTCKPVDPGPVYPCILKK